MSISKETQALLAAARGDGPASVTSDAIWSKLEVNLGIVPAAAASGVRALDAPSSTPPSPPAAPPPPPPPVPAAAALKSSIALKAGLVGGSVGSAITVAAVFAGMRLFSPTPQLAPNDPVTNELGQSSLAMEHGQRVPSVLVPLAPPAAEAPSVSKIANAPPARAEVVRAPVIDPLSREVSLVMDARQALIGGDAERALQMARAARDLRGQLVQEAMTIEVRSLRALGRDAEAERVDSKLRTGR